MTDLQLIAAIKRRAKQLADDAPPLTALQVSLLVSPCSGYSDL